MTTATEEKRMERRREKNKGGEARGKAMDDISRGPKDTVKKMVEMRELRRHSFGDNAAS